MGSNELFTGERFIPGILDDKLEIEHYQRYLGVRELVRGKAVLDAACGEGYGSRLMADTAAQVTGLDIDGDTIGRAREKYREQGNLRFLQGSVAEIPLEDDSVDAVVSFETIEHVPEEVQHLFLGEIARVLRPDGFLVMSTPNKRIYSDLYDYKNEFHVKEFYHDEFLAFLREKFQYLKLYNQAFQVASVLSSCEGGESSLSFYTRGMISGRGGYDQDGKYYIAVASNRQTETEGLASVFVSEPGEYERNIQRILELQKAEELRNEHIGKLNREAEIAGENIRRLQAEEEERNAHISRLDGQIEQLEAQKRQLEKEIEPLRAKVQEQAQMIRNKEGHIELLLEVERAYEHEKNTYSYKFGKKLQRMGDAVLPPKSRRRFFARVLLNVFRHPRLMLHVINPRRIRNYIKYSRLEGMDGVKRRYEEAVDIERSHIDPAGRLDLDLSSRTAQEGAGQGGGKVYAEKSSAGKSLSGMTQAGQAKSVEEYERVTLPVWENPLVSIIIPAYNQFDYTYHCVRSILRNSGSIAYEVILADDCSTDLTKEAGQIIENIRVVTTQENVRFLRNCNHAAKDAKGSYILFLNNDTQVQPGWLEPLVRLIERDDRIGMVGSKLIYPDGLLQEAGGIVWKDASAWNYGHRQNPGEPEFNYVKEADYISGAAIMIRSALWKEIGGFDESFAPAYCEDSDLAFEVRRRGYKVVYQPKSVVVHFEGISNGTDVTSGQKKYQVENQKKFYDKWKEELDKKHFENGTNVFLARERSGGQKHVLVIDHYVPQYDKDAGSKTTFMYLKMLAGKGWHITFLSDNFYPHEPYTTELQQMGIFVLYGSRYAQHWKEWLAENISYFDIFYLNRPHISIKYIDFIKKRARGKIIYYGHDLHFLRLKREYEISGEKKLLEESDNWKKQELYLMRKADMSYYPSEVEVEEIHKIDNSIPVKAITAYVYDKFLTVNYRADQRKGILFVGGFGHPPNLDAVLWFTKKIYPEVYQRTKAPFYIVGSNPPREITDLKEEGVVVKGFVTEEELMELYGSCRMAVVPLRYGAGVKGKVVEALYYGIPIVTTSVGAEGIDGLETAAIVEDEESVLAQVICESYHNNKELDAMSRKSQQFVRKYFSVDAVWEGIRDDFA